MEKRKVKNKKFIPVLLKVLVVIVVISAFISYFARMPVTNSYFTYWVRSEQNIEY